MATNDNWVPPNPAAPYSQELDPDSPVYAEQVKEELTAEQLDTLYFRAMLLAAQARQYDVLLTLVANLAGEEVAKDLLEMHSRGGLMFPPLEATINETGE